MRKLEASEWEVMAPTVPEWRFSAERGGMITREFRFASFAQAFGFMAQLAITAERLEHHPEWFNVAERVLITLTTHDVQGLSSNDIDFAAAADRAYAAHATPPAQAPAQ